MKRLSLLLWFAFQILAVRSQAYEKDEIISVDSITYRFRISGDLIFIDNIANRLGNRKEVFLDGREYADEFGRETLVTNRPGTIEKAFEQTFTKDEFDKMRTSKSWMTIGYVIDNDGKVLEVDFDIMAFGIMREIPLSKYAALEKNLKKFVRGDLSPNGKTLRYIRTMSIANFSKMNVYKSLQQITPEELETSDPGFRKGGGEVRGN